ncbi:MAG: dihydropteridine reductase [Oscillospiraceae bacterium]|nr:dihydropteridine reductase [Oscillospiraceae bacterium]
MNQNDQRFMAQKIRAQYMEKENTKLDELRALDAKVKKPANVFGYVFGTIGALVMGSGMSLCMDVIEPGTYFGITIGENMIVPGIILGLMGMFMAAVNYPLYKGILNRRRKKYAPRILELSEKLMRE